MLKLQLMYAYSMLEMLDFKYTQSVSYGVPIAIGAFDACIFAYPQILFVFHLHLCHLIQVTVAQQLSLTSCLKRLATHSWISFLTSTFCVYTSIPKDLEF
jgi:hypothetical protein